MYYRIATALSVGALCFLLVGQMPGQQPAAPPDGAKPADVKDSPPPKPTDDANKPVAPPDEHDPTKAKGSLRDILNKPKGPNNAATKLPAIVIRGRVIVKDKPPAVLLEVDGRIYRVTKGSLMNGPGNTTLRVMEVTRSEIKLQVSPQNESTVLETIVLQ